jgi:hypothetical protein
MRGILNRVVGCALLLGAGLAVAPVAESTVAVAAGATGCQPGSEFELRDMINSFRAANGGLAPLPLSAELDRKAQAWADWMMTHHSMAHSNTVYGTLAQGVTTGWSAIGENVAYNSGGLTAAQVALQNSPPHRANLLGNWTEMGVGISRGPDGIIWVAQTFVRRPASTTLQATSAFNAVTPTVVYESVGREAGKAMVGFMVAGTAGVPSGATAGVVTIEATGAAGPGFVQGLAPRQSPGTTSNVNLVEGAAANTAVVPLLADGQMVIYDSVAVHLKVTLVGYFAPTGGPASAGRFTALTPTRLLDTRPGTAVGFTGPSPRAGDTLDVQVTGRGGVPTSGVSAVVLNVVATETHAGGSVQVGAAGMPVGAWRNLLVSRAGQTIANVVIVPVDADGRIALNTTLDTDLVVDVQGWFNSSGAASYAGLFVPTAPARFIDTRQAGVAAGLRTVEVPLRNDMPLCPSAVLGNLTLLSQASPTFAQAGPWALFTDGSSSNINADTPYTVVANAALLKTGQGSYLGVYTPNAAHFIVDLSGWFV